MAALSTASVLIPNERTTPVLTPNQAIWMVRSAEYADVLVPSGRAAPKNSASVAPLSNFDFMLKSSQTYASEFIKGRWNDSVEE